MDVIIVGLLLAFCLFFCSSSVNGEEKINKGIYYDNFKYTDNVILKESDGLNIDYDAQLSKVGDYYEISFDVINSSTVDVRVSNLIVQDNDKYIDYQLTYSNGKKIRNGDILKQGEKKGLKYKVCYKKSVDVDEYVFDSSFNIGYEQIL